MMVEIIIFMMIEIIIFMMMIIMIILQGSTALREQKVVLHEEQICGEVRSQAGGKLIDDHDHDDYDEDDGYHNDDDDYDYMNNERSGEFVMINKKISEGLWSFSKPWGVGGNRR